MAEKLDVQAPAIVNIPDFPAGCKLLGTWTPHNICLWSKDPRGIGVDCGLHEVHWEAARWNRVTRKLVNQSHGYFMNLQQQCRKSDSVSDSTLVKYSRFYRSTLHECVLGLKKLAEDPTLSPTDQRQYQHEGELYSIMELVWHLCEVLFIEVLPAGCLVQQLLEWIRWHGNQEDDLLRRILTHPRPEEHGSYWRAVYGLVLRGRTNEARDLLQHHSFSHTMPDVFASIMELLRKTPMVRSTGSLSRAELHRHWQEWRGECRRRRDAGEFTALRPLHLLASVLSGEEEAFGEPEILDSCQHWYELMVGKLLFTSPLVVSSDYDLVYTAEGCSKLYPSHYLGSLDEILLAALRNDIMDVIKLTSSSFTTWWCVAHLTNLLNHKKLLVASQLKYGDELSEFLVLEYASSLMTHQSLWQVAMDYFSECETQGRHYMALHIERVPLMSDRKAFKVLSVCDKYQLTEQAQSICRVLAMQAYRYGRLGEALSWCLRVKDSAFAAFLAEKYFDHYQSLGEFMDLDLLDHLGASMLLNEKLTFLCKYREFHRLHERKDYVAAGDLLVQLLLSNTVPKRFWMTMLTDALQLLGVEGEVVFNTEQTYALAHCLQELTLSPPRQSNQSDCSIKSHDQAKSVSEEGKGKVNLLRLAITRNLARALMEESNTREQ